MLINTDFGRKIKIIEIAHKFSKLSNMKIPVLVVFIAADAKKTKRIFLNDENPFNVLDIADCWSVKRDDFSY